MQKFHIKTREKLKFLYFFQKLHNFLHNLCKNYGAEGGKLLGAGGGGFFFLVYNNLNRLRFLNFIKKFYTPKCLPFEKGTEVIYKEISKK
jgi:galactokinase/mevalonate kinase-like predicted kinase